MNLKKTGLKNTVSAILTVALILLAAPAASNAQTAGTAFTYQGQLKDGGRPADGEYDLTFSIYDGADTRIAGPIGMENLEVTNGLFTVTLDFGSNVFDGDARFLEIGIRPGDSGASFTRLTPRQELTPTPYAATALKTVGVDGHSLDSADGSHQDAVYVTNYGKVNMSYGGFEVYDEAGHGITFTTQNFSLDAYPSESAAYRYQAAEKRHRFFTDGTNRLEIGPTGNIGIGVIDPNEKLEVAGTVQMDGFRLGTSSTAGHVLTTDANGNGTWQALPTAWRKDAYDNLYYGDGNVGIGMGSAVTPAYPLHVEGQTYLAGNVGIGAAPSTDALTVGGSAKVSGVVEAANYEYDSPQEHTLTVLGNTFHPTESGVEYGSAWGIWALPSEQDAYFRAPVHLPDGAVITAMSARIADSSPTQDLTVGLCYIYLPSLGQNWMASVTSEGEPGHNTVLSTSDIDSPVINNRLYGYYVHLGCGDWESGLQLFAVQITYTVNHAD